jgi:hypothetical protein
VGVYLRELLKALEREMSYRRGAVVPNTVLGRQALLWEGQGDIETMLAAISAEPERR